MVDNSRNERAACAIQIKIVDGFDEADAADLKEIVHVFVVSRETLDHAQDKAQISTL